MAVTILRENDEVLSRYGSPSHTTRCEDDVRYDVAVLGAVQDAHFDEWFLADKAREDSLSEALATTAIGRLLDRGYDATYGKDFAHLQDSLKSFLRKRVRAEYCKAHDDCRKTPALSRSCRSSCKVSRKKP